MFSTYAALYPNLRLQNQAARHGLNSIVNTKKEEPIEEKPDACAAPEVKPNEAGRRDCAKPKPKPKPRKKKDDDIKIMLAKLLQDKQQEKEQEVVRTPLVRTPLKQQPIIINQPVKVKDCETGTDRPEHYPEKGGKRGFQPKRTIEQKKEAYLNRLSTKSLNKAKKEMAQVDEILEDMEGKRSNCKEVQQELKKKLTLVNRAILFAESDKEDDQDNREITDPNEE